MTASYARRDVECASWACIAGAVSSAGVGCCAAVLRLRICVVACASLHRVSLWLLCDCAALRGIVSAVDCSCAFRAAFVRYRRVAVAAAVAGSPCYTLVRDCPAIVHVAVTVCHCCNARADGDCSTVVEVLCAPPGVAALDAAARGRGLVCMPRRRCVIVPW